MIFVPDVKTDHLYSNDFSRTAKIPTGSNIDGSCDFDPSNIVVRLAVESCLSFGKTAASGTVLLSGMHISARLMLTPGSLVGDNAGRF